MSYGLAALSQAPAGEPSLAAKSAWLAGSATAVQ